MKHAWVMLAFTPIQVELTPEGHLHTFITDVQEEVSREDSLLICWICKRDLTIANYDGECDGDQK